MKLPSQLAHVIIAPLALFRLRGRAIAWLLVYLVLAAAVLAGIARFLVAHQHDALDLVARYLFPEGWRFAAERVVDHFLKTQLRVVLINATVGVSVLMLSVLLFPVKERLSAAFERGSRLTTDPITEHPLWLQAFEELWLAGVYATLQMTIFWVGYPPDPMRKKIAVVMSYGTLFFQFGVDFLSPLLQRHRLRYGAILKALLTRPLLLFGFGAVFALPPMLVGRHVMGHPELSFARSIAMMFGTSLGCIALAIVSGTYVASRLLPAAAETRPFSFPVRALAWFGGLALLGMNLYTFGVVGRSFHHKSQILKCKYHVLPNTVSIKLPDMENLLRDGAKLGISFDVEIENPTPFDVEIEKNRLEVRHAGSLMALAAITPLRVPSHGKATPHVEIPVKLDAKAAIDKGRQLLDRTKWAATLYLQVTPEIELPVHLLVAKP